MKSKLWLAILLLAFAWPAQAQLVTPGGGGSGAASSILFTNGALPVGSASAASQCLQTNAGSTAVILGSCGGSASFPAGNAPQIAGFSAVNTSEAETLSGDAALTRAGANSYTIAVTKTNGTAFGAAATLGVGTGLTSTGGNITLTVPVTAANGGSGVISPAAHSLLQAEGASAFGVITAATAGNVIIDQGTGVDWASKTLSGDSTLSSAGVMANLGLHFGAANAVALPTTAPTSGGIPYFSSATALASSAVLGAGLPVVGGGAGVAPSTGTKSGNTTIFATTTGSLVSNDCVKIDASGNFIDAGAACGTSGGGGYPSGAPPQIAGFSATNTAEAETLSGDATLTRAGLNSYTIAVTKTNGTAFTALATAAVPLTVPNGGTGQTTLTSGAPLFGNGTSAVTLGTVTGNTTKVATSTGTLTSGHCADWDANGNIIDAGAACGTGGGGSPIFTHTITETSGAATMVVQSSTTPALDTDYVALNANATITTPATTGMADGQEIYLIGSTSGTAYTVGFTAGSGVTLATIILGDATPFGTPAACGAVPATGYAWFKWKYSSGNVTLTLVACGINAPAAALATTLGGTGLASPTAHSLMLAEGSSAFNLITAATAGNIVVDQGSGSDFASKAVSGDATLASSGALTVTKTSGTAFTALATAAVPLSVANGGHGSGTAPSSAQIPIAQSATSYTPQTVGGDATISASGSLTVTKTSGTAFTALATAAVPLTLANGGTGQTATSAWPIATNINTTVSGATNVTPSSTFWITNQDLTMTASAILTIIVPSWANQMENLKVCQNGTGGFTPTFAAGTGLTITGTFPACTTTASKCCDVGLYFDSTTTAYITGSNAGPL